ncbi:MAG TPA: SRPBCC family protein [Mycobacteriales bacterium]|jgi:ribosome-associated toxin RatA of RatAB toxin-antitoxin module
MPTVTTDSTSTLPADRVWDAVLDLSAFASQLDDVRRIDVLSRDGDVRVTSWSVLLKGSVLEWVERETVDHAARRLVFEQLEGDLAHLEGYWQVTGERGGGTVVRLHVDFDLGVPLLEDMLNPVAARALEDNARSMLSQLHDRLAA